MFERIPASADAVHGRVTVQLVDDDTGRVVFEETGDNFLSLQSLEVAKWWQRMMWGLFTPVETANAAGHLPSEMPWFPATHLAYWNDSATEASGSETIVRKELVGWASRHPLGSASGKRGVVNVTESELTDASAKWVFDWVTSQGNGTFQSVGWTRVSEVNGFPMPAFPADGKVSVTSATATAAIRNSLAWNSTSSKWIILNLDSSAVKAVSVADTGGAASVEATLSGWSNLTATGIAHGVTMIGSDYAVAGYYRTGSVDYPKLNRTNSSGTETWSRTESSLANVYYRDVTYDGAKLWTAGSDGILRRHSASDGTIDLTVTPTLAPTTLTGVAYDSADGHLWIAGRFGGATDTAFGVAKVDTSGGTVGPLYGLPSTVQTITTTSPYTGQYQFSAARPRTPYTIEMDYARSSGTTSTNLFAGPNLSRTSTVLETAGAGTNSVGGLALAVKSGTVYAGHGSSTNFGTNRVIPLDGASLGSRVRLSSAVTKTSSQNLKITYQFDFV